MGHEALATNLRRLRETRKWTQQQLADAAGLSRVAYRNIETAQSVPRVDTLQALARALGARLQDLVTPVERFQHVRFRSLRRLNTREQILDQVARRLRDWNELEQLLGEKRQLRLRDLPLPASFTAAGAEERARRAAGLVRARLGLGEVEPIRDICGLLEATGIKILTVQVASDAFFGLSVAEEDGGPAVVVNTWPRISVERWIFTAAHELGHLVLHLGDYDVSQTREERDQEKEANVFATHLLIPEETFRREWETTYGMALVDRVLKVKRMLRVSYRTVLYRLVDAGLVGKDVWGRFQKDWKERTGDALLKASEPEALAADAFRSTFPESSRAGEPERLSPIDFTEERLLALVRRAIESEAVSLSRGAEILGMSLGEMRKLSASWIG